MSTINNAFVLGRLGQDPDLRTTGNGNSVCNMSVATNHKFGDEEHTEWHRIVVWGKQAESCKEYLAKGRMVAVSGRIQTRKWDDKDGNTRYSVEIIASPGGVTFLPTGTGNGNGSSEPAPRTDDAVNTPDADDMPF
jgi:single-strand DNA-binding protein